MVQRQGDLPVREEGDEVVHILQAAPAGAGDDGLAGPGDLLDEYPVVHVRAGQLDDLHAQLLAEVHAGLVERGGHADAPVEPDLLGQLGEVLEAHLSVQGLLDVADVLAPPEILVDEVVHVAELQLDGGPDVVVAHHPAELVDDLLPRSRRPQWLLAISRTNRSSKGSRLMMVMVLASRRERRNQQVFCQFRPFQEGVEILQGRAHHAPILQATGAGLGFEGLGRVQYHLAEERPGTGHAFRKHRIHLRMAPDAEMAEPEGGGEPGAVRKADARGRIETYQAVGEVGGLGLADAVVAAVVVDHQQDGEAVVLQGLQLLQVHHQAAVPGQADHGPAARGHAGADGRGQIVAHAGAAAVAVEPLPPLELRCLESGHAGGAIPRHHHLALRQVPEEGLRECVGVHRAVLFAVPGQHDGIAFSPRAAPGEVVRVRRPGEGESVALQGFEELAQVRLNRQVDGQGSA